MDVLPHSTEIFEGEYWVGSKLQEEVKIKKEVEFVVENIIRGVQDLLYLEICSMQNDDENELRRRLTETGERVTGSCSRCHEDYYTVEQRCADTYENPPDYLNISWGEEILCQSCQCDGKKCECCGISEKLVKIHCDRNANFSFIPNTSPPQYLCVECAEEEDDLFRYDYEDEAYMSLGGGGDGYENTYRGEFEIDTEGDETLLEDDDEWTKKTKDMMKEVMDEMFEVSADISENTYMKIVNKMKQVYERL